MSHTPVTYGPGVSLWGMYMAKVYMTTDAQMRQLRSRGLKVAGSADKKILEKENYYNLINGYKPLFIDYSYQGQGERFLTGTTLRELYALFLFDRELRSVFLRYILEIENNVRSLIAHDFSKKYGHDNYLKVDNFDKTNNSLADIADLISILQRDIAVQIKSNNPMIIHYVYDYGYIPPWVLVNIITFGTLSKFYRLLKQRDQNDIGRCLNIMPHDLKTYLKNLSLARNWCAHDMRFFDKRVKSKITSNAIHSALGISSASYSSQAVGKDDIFSFVIIMKQMLPKKAFNKFFFSLRALINRLSVGIHTIQISDIMNELGFPSNWEMIKDI